MAQRVDLSTLPDYEAHAQLHPLINALREKKRIIVIAGAGISASAGIPTFESMSAGSRSLFDKNMYGTLESTELLNKMMCDMYHRIEIAQPTQFHLLIAALAKEGRLQRLYTQNIDGIDTQLPLLNTLIPLPEKHPWPKTIQVHGDLRTVRCESHSSTHLTRFDPTLFAPRSSSYCMKCEGDERLKEGGRSKTITIPIIRPRIWLYNDFDYPDAEAIDAVRAKDFRAKPDAVIVVGTALKVPSAKIFARSMCRTAREYGGFAAWINLKAPPQDLSCFNIVIQGDSEKVAMHVSSWWLKECPNVLSDTQIQILQDKCKLFIARSTEAALNRAFTEADNDSLLKVLRHEKNKSRILKIEEGGEVLFIPPERSQRSGLSANKAVNHNMDPLSQYRKIPSQAPRSIPFQSSEILPKLSDCWIVEMSKRLSKIVVFEDKRGRESSSVVTKISLVGYKAADIAGSLWRLKPGEELNDDVLNAYLELLKRSISVSQYIESTWILNLEPGKPWKGPDKLIQTGKYSIFIPIHSNQHWTFAVLTSRQKNDCVRWQYYDSLGGEPPRNFLIWLHERFLKAKLEKIPSSSNPMQKNDVDCGLFILMGIRLMSTGHQHLSQTQSDEIIPNFRQRVLAELLASSLNPSSAQFEWFKLREINDNTAPPPQASLSGRIGSPNIPAIAGEQNRQVNHPEGNDPPSLFLSPSPVLDPGEDAKTISSEELDVSEEELVQKKPLIQKVPRKKDSPEQLAFTFAEEKIIVDMLREAVSVERASQRGSRNPQLESIRLADLWSMISTEKRALKQRHVHYRFSRQFWAEMGELNRVPHQRGPVPKATISKVMRKLEITNKTSGNYVLKLAQRSSIWTELAEIFKDDLDHPSVVLCAIPNATYTLETMTLTNRKLFFETIISRLEDPDNGILARLKAADALYWALMHNGLPARDLLIESANKHLPFKQMVSFQDEIDEMEDCTNLSLPTRLTSNYTDGTVPRLHTRRFTPNQLRDLDDIATDLIIDSVYPEVPIRKNSNVYASTFKDRKYILSIIKDVVIKQKNPARAVSLLLQVHDLKRFLDSLESAKEKETFQMHIRKYVDIYLPSCPFEICSTTRYKSDPEAAIRARESIEKGEIMFLRGTQVRFTGEDAPDQDDFSITESSRRKIFFRMLGPARFVNHDCEPNARLKSSESSEEVKIIALRKIWVGEEITIFYDENTFGEGNCDCLCETSKPLCESISEQTTQRELRSTRRETLVEKSILASIEHRHEDLYGLGWPRTE